MTFSTATLTLTNAGGDYPVIDILLTVLGSTALGGWMGSILARRSAREANDIEKFRLFIEAYQQLAGRVTGVEKQLSTVNTELAAERNAHKAARVEHQRVRDLLRLALQHIQNVITWSVGDRVAPIPVPPRDLIEKGAIR